MANKKVSQLTSKPSVLTTDLFPIADPSTGQLYKTTISDLGTAIGSGVSSVNGLVGAVVLDTDDIQELVSPTNKWFTDTRARAALSASSPLAYNSGTGVFSIPAATSSQNGYLTSTDWSTFNGKQAALSGTGFVKISGTTISYDNTSYLPLTGGTLTGTLIGTRAEFTTSTLVDGILVNNGSGRGIRIVNGGAGYGLIINNETASSAIPFVIQKSGLDKIYFTDSGAGNFTSSLTASSFVKSGGTSSQYLMADGSVSTLTNPVTGTGTSGIVAKFNGTSTITDSIIYDNGTRVSIGADVTTSNKFTAVASTTSSYAVVAQASGAANGFWATLSGTGEIFRGQTSGGSYFIINNGGNAFLNGNLNVGDFSSTSYKLNVVGTGNFTEALSGTSATFSSSVTATQLNTSSGVALQAVFNATSNNPYIRFDESGSAKFFIGNRNSVSGGTGSGYDLYTASANDLRVYSGGGLNTVFSTSGNLIVGSDSQSSPSGADKFISVFGGQDCSLILQDSVQLWELYVNDDFYINRGSTNALTVLRTNGNVGIGTTAPNRLLEVATGSDTYLRVTGNRGNADGVHVGNIEFYNSNTSRLVGEVRGITGTGGTQSNSGQLAFYTNDAGTYAERMRITSVGQVQIKQSGNGHDNGGLSIFNTSSNIWNVVNGGDNSLYLGYNGTSKGYFVAATGIYVAISDKNKKKDFEESNIGLAEVMQLKPTLFRMISDSDKDDKQLGFLAQEVKDYIPQAYAETSNGFIGLQDRPILAAAIKAIQELKAELDILKNK